MPETRVIEIKDEDLSWGFNDGEPAFSVVNGTYSSSEKVDPFPCYAHDAGRVREELDRTARLFPLAADVYVYVSHFESVSRTNAHASPGYDYNAECDADRKYPLSTGTIVLSGKRIPLHPAMTRYLVSHEYGHLVEYSLKHAGLLDMEAYAVLRGAEDKPAYYGGRTWHRSLGEIFANDFRILVASREPEFWPHKVPYPTQAPGLVEWWENARNTFAEFRAGKEASRV